MLSYIIVIGAANIDIGGHPDNTLIRRDSNLGKVLLSLGGVGRNISHNARLLGLEVKFLTALGNDLYAENIKSHCNQIGIDISPALVINDASTSTYLFINNKEGDMELAISDMGIYSYLTPEYLKEKMELINNAELIILDTNISTESITYLANNCTVPIFADPVSCTKAKNLLPSLNRLHTICPNLIEAQILSGITIDVDEDVLVAADILLKKGLQRVFITLGPRGVYCADEQEQFLLPCLPTNLINATGAGDAFTASLALSWARHYDLRNTGLVGLAAASIAAESKETINPFLNLSELNQRLNKMEEN